MVHHVLKSIGLGFPCCLADESVGGPVSFGPGGPFLSVFLYRKWPTIVSFESLGNGGDGCREMVPLSRRDGACGDRRVEREALPSARSVLLLIFQRLDIPFLCGEADVDWLAFLP